MPRFSFSTPVLPGRDAREVTEMLRGRQDEYEQSRRHAGISLERVYVQTTPMGDFVVVHFEADRDFPAISEASMTSGLAIDRDFYTKLSEVHGIDFSQPGPTPTLENVGEWIDPEVSERRPGLAFVAPLNPGAADAGRAFAREAFQARREGFAASRRALGVSVEIVTLQQTPEGDVICGYIEAPDPVEANRRFAASQGEFDVWFKGELKKIFPPFVDFDQPLPPIAQIWDWDRSAVSA
jgi:hypothetical protein